MLRNVFLKSLWEQRASFLWWVGGVTALCVFVVAYYPSITRTQGLNEFFQEAPEWIKAFVGENVEEYTSPAGYLNGELFFMMAPIIFLIFAISRGSGAIAGEEQKGTLDLLLANPLTRRRVVLEKAASMALAALALGAVFWAVLALGCPAVGMEISLANLAAATFSCVLLGLLFGAVALALGCATGSRGTSIGVATAVALAAFFLNSIAQVVEGLRGWKKLSPFYYYIGAEPLKHGLNVAHAAVLLCAALVLVGLSVLLFDRRDVLV